MRPQRTFDNETTYPGKRWIKTIDPIRNMSLSEAKAIYDAARRFGSPRLQKMYDEIEAVDPILMTCVDRRQAALSGLGYTVKALAFQPLTSNLADEQRDAVQQFLTGIDNFTDAISHLELAYFRGFSHCQPIWENLSTVQPSTSNLQPVVPHINLLDNWNFLQDIDGHWLWNPNCFIAPAQCEPITPEARLLSLCLKRAIDYPALSIYIRKALGERDWGRFIERYGIPPVDVTMAANATEEQKGAYLATAEDARDGRPAVWPSGTTTNRAEGSRGQDPFTAFIEHQEKLIVLMATGGTLTSLAQSDTGSLAGGAQMDVWREIVTRDAQVISEVIERGLVRPFIAQAFPGQPLAVAFELGTEKKPTARESADLATALKSAGYIVVQDELEEATGLSLERDTSATPSPFGLAAGMARAPWAAASDGRARAHWAAASDGRARAPWAAASDGRARAPWAAADPSGALADLIAAFKADNKPLADRLQAILKEIETTNLQPLTSNLQPSTSNLQPSTSNLQPLIQSLLADLPSLLPDDPAMSAILAEEMAKQFKEPPCTVTRDA